MLRKFKRAVINKRNKDNHCPPKSLFGTREWAGNNATCCTGCINNCFYCYSRGMAVRFGRREFYDWSRMEIREKDVQRTHRKYENGVMFPSSHDIFPENLEACLKVLRNLLAVGNQVLIVTKPRLEVIKVLCSELSRYKDRILFRFTIGAMDNDTLHLWEPGATCYEERKQSLQYARDAGYQTSVSCEPMLDADHIDELVFDLLPFVTETIWIGKMNHLGRIKVHSPEINNAITGIRASQSDANVISIYNRLNVIPQVRWKESIRKVIDRQGF